MREFVRERTWAEATASDEGLFIEGIRRRLGLTRLEADLH